MFNSTGRLAGGNNDDLADRLWEQVKQELPTEKEEVHLALLYAFWLFAIRFFCWSQN